MVTENFKLSSALVLKLRGYNFTSQQMIDFAYHLQSKFFDIVKLSELMQDEDITFNYDPDTNVFELIDPNGLMGNVNKTISLDSFSTKMVNVPS